MTLREELGKRLYDVGNLRDWALLKNNPAPPWGSAGSMTRECWRSLADECISQMEWARTLHGERWEGDDSDGTRHIVDLDEQPLTLAPKDWKP